MDKENKLAEVILDKENKLTDQENKLTEQEIKNQIRRIKIFVASILIFAIAFSLGYVFLPSIKEGDEEKHKLQGRTKVPVEEQVQEIEAVKDTEVSKETVYLNEESFYGPWSVKLEDVTEANSLDSWNGEKATVKPKMKFIKLKLKVTNKDLKPNYFSDLSTEVAIISEKNNYTYNYDKDATYDANDKDLLDDEMRSNVYDPGYINPNLSKVIFLVFVVPETFTIDNGILLYGDKYRANTKRASIFLGQRS